jgi:hypothetical protein
MGIFSKNKNKSKNKLMLVFNIESSNVGGALFWTQDSGVPKIIFSTTESILLQEKINIDRFLVLTMQALDVVAEKIYKMGLGTPEDIFCVLSSPWHISQTRIINFKRNTPFIFTAKLAESLVQKEIHLFEEEYLSKVTNINALNRAFEFKNIKTILNGYETSEPLNKKINELEMTIFISMGEELVLNKIENTIGKYFHFNQIRFSSFNLSFFTVVRDMYIEQEDFLLLDIDGEVTNISMVKKNVLRESITFPLGRNFLVREIASGLKCTLNEASSLFSLFKNKHTEKSVTQKMTLILDQIKTKWLESFQESLSNLSSDISIPSTIYMVTERSSAEFFSQIIESEQYNQYALTESRFKIIFLDLPSLIIDSIYINRFLINPAKTGRA